MSERFEFVLAGKTYQTSKHDIVLAGKAAMAMARILEPTGVDSWEDLANLGEKHPKAMIAGAGVMIHIPELLWEFLPINAKNDIGGYEVFKQNLSQEFILPFFNWVNHAKDDAKNFTSGTSVASPTVPIPPSTKFNSPSQDSMAGTSTPLNPLVS